MPNYIKLGNLRIEIPEPANNGGGGGGGGSSSLLTGLLAFYNLNDLSDASGNNRTLTNNGNVTFSSGKIGNAALINADQSLTIAPDVQYGNTFSITCWAKWLQQSQASLVAQYPGCWMAIYGNGSIQLSDLESWAAYSNSGLVTTGVWNHYALVVTNGYAKVYLNNTLVLEENNSQMTLNSSAGRGFGIGGETLSQRLGQKEIDAFGVWNRALSDAEVAELYNAGTGKEHPFA